MSGNLTIGEAVAQTGLTAKTIRFYESAGVIKPVHRASNAYRRFAERDIQRLLLVKRARDLGLSLDEVKNIVSECIDKGCMEARQYVAAKVPGYISGIGKRLIELQKLKSQLLSMQEYYEKHGKEWRHSTDACCEIIPISKEG